MLISKLSEVRDRVKHISPYPLPPKINYTVEKSADWIKNQLAPLEVNWLQLDSKYFLTNQDNFLNIVAWDWTDTYDYVREVFDCDKFAIMFKSRVNERFYLNQVGVVLDYKSGHAYNLIIFPDGNIMLLEPQSDSLFCHTKRITMFYALKDSFVIL